MNTQLAKEVAIVLRDKWKSGELDSEDIYNELIARGVQVPEGDMDEILQSFKKAGVINGVGYMHPEALKQDGAMVIGFVNIELLDQLDFD